MEQIQQTQTSQTQKSDIFIDSEVCITREDVIIINIEKYITEFGNDQSFSTESNSLHYFIENNKGDNTPFSSWLSDKIHLVGDRALLPKTLFQFDFGVYSKYMTIELVTYCEEEIFSKIGSSMSMNISCYNYKTYSLNKEDLDKINMGYVLEEVVINQDLACRDIPSREDPSKKEFKMINKLSVLVLNLFHKYTMIGDLVSHPANMMIKDKDLYPKLYDPSNFQTNAEKQQALQEGKKVSFFTKEDFVRLSRDEMFYEVQFSLDKESRNKTFFSVNNLDCTDWYNTVLLIEAMWDITSHYYLTDEVFIQEYPDIKYRSLLDVNFFSQDIGFNPQFYFSGQVKHLGNVMNTYQQQVISENLDSNSVNIDLLYQIRKTYIDDLYPKDTIILCSLIPYGNVLESINTYLVKSLNDIRISNTQKELIKAQTTAVGEGFRFDDDKFFICKVLEHAEDGIVVSINRSSNYNTQKATDTIFIPYDLILNLNNFKQGTNTFKQQIYNYNISVPPKVSKSVSNSLIKSPRQEVYLSYLLDIMFQQVVIIPLYQDIKMKYYMTTSNSNIRINNLLQ